MAEAVYAEIPWFSSAFLSPRRRTFSINSLSVFMFPTRTNNDVEGWHDRLQDASEFGFHVADYVIFAGMISFSIGIGVYSACSGGGQKTTLEYLVGNRRLRMLPVAISLVVSFQSSILVLGYPAEVYIYGGDLLWESVGLMIAMLVSARVVAPLFHPLKLTSVFEGGLKAVVWTDVLQCLIMTIGMIAVIIKATFDVGDFRKVLRINYDNLRINYLNFDPDPTVRHTFWSLCVGSSIGLFGMSFNQATVQRISSVKTLSEAKKILYFAGPAFFVLGAIVNIEGMVTFAYFNVVGCDPMEAGIISNANQVGLLEFSVV
ncbi:sodium-coupled monocarboxylate transporter 1-like [Pecten maximus]|uniref:sodium-coupled monocarboxylate transporter 1-like n=1 Tax=Pecten maximus TaxID=6579 RepID=UPI0014589538|nr:sodium-coupled monocarboxylate transporter 1-like [Pecten maximus]